MTLEQAIKSIHAPQGVSSVIYGIMNGDYSVMRNPDALNSTVVEIDYNVQQHQKRLDDCKSDYVYWSILGELAYWKAVQNIYKAAALVGIDNLPEVPAPKLDGCAVMDAIYHVEQFGKTILKLSQEQPNN